MPNHPKKQKSFLGVPDTVYPVTIDPTLEVSDNLNGAGAIEDSVIYSGTPNSNYGGFTYLTVGYGDSTYGVGRAIFRLPGLYNSTEYQSLPGSQIRSVKFYTWDASGHDNLPINIYPNVSSTWTESGVNWSNAPQYYTGNDTGTTVTANMTSGAYTCFNITSIVKWWKSGNYVAENCGFTMVNPNETSDLYKKVPCSSETAVTNRRPYVVMTYVQTLSITSSSNYITRGASAPLSIVTDEPYSSVTWTSSNNNVATVSATGVVLANNPGYVRINATVTFPDNTKCYVSKQLTIILPTGVYRIRNNTTGWYLNVNQGMINDFAAVTQYSDTGNASAKQTKFQQMWKIKHIGDGMYTLRPYHKLDMCLYVYGPNDHVYIRRKTADSSTNNTQSGYVSAQYRWSIGYIGSGIVIRNDGERDATLQIENDSTAQNAQTRADTYGSTDTCYWTFTTVTNPGSGVILYDTENQQQIYTTDVFYIAPEEERSIEDLGIGLAMYSPTKIDQTFTLSKNSSCVELTSEGKIKGVKYSGESSVTVSATAAALSSDNTFSFNFKVTAIPNSTYYIRNIETRKYIGVDDGTIGNGKILEQETFDSYDEQKWTFTLCPDGYYTISLADHPSYYMRTNSNDSNLIISNAEISSDAKWLITLSSKGNYIFKPQTAVDSENEDEQNDVAGVNGYVFNTDGVNIVLRSYTDDDDYKDEWELYDLVISLVNYYDSSFDAELVANIEAANCFAAEVFSKAFSLSIRIDGTATLKSGTPADKCKAEHDAIQLGQTIIGDIHCDGNCSAGDGSDCKDVVKNVKHIYNNTLRENSHIYVMWTNRTEGANCKITTEDGETTHTILYDNASVLEQNGQFLPVIYVNRIPEAITAPDYDTSIEYQGIAMRLILTHELVHTLGMSDVYDDTSHCSDGSNCIMNRLQTQNDNSEDYYITFYNDIIDYLNEESNESPFCEDCTAGIEELLATNQPIEGN